MEHILQVTNAFIWGVPVLSLILIVGAHLTVRTKFIQIRRFSEAIRRFLDSFTCRNAHSQGTSGYKALCTALAATVGTGNIAGVAGAIAIAGPGVIFWMWICALLGMVTKLAEVVLALYYRVKNRRGEYIGGPMYIIINGLPSKYHFLAYVYCFFGVVAAFGVGNATQVNAVVEGVKNLSSILKLDFGQKEAFAIGIITASLAVAAFSDGCKRLGNWAEKLVPFASVIYIIMSIGVLIVCSNKIPSAIESIIVGAFSPKAVTGGVITSMFLTLRVGASRGVFTNEAGMGTASIAHASADVSDPVEQGLMGVMEVFLDTVLICSLTALVILCSGIAIPYGNDPGLTLTLDAFCAVYGDWSSYLITVLVCIFAFATILGWGLYGARCAQFLFGEKAWNGFVVAQVGCILFSVTLETSVVWLFAEIVNGLMAIPNLIALVLLSPVLVSVLKKYPSKKEAYRLG